VVLDNVPGVGRLGACALRRPLLLALGPERGWTDADRALLRHHHFEPCTLGERILRVETACVAALAIAKSRLGLM
jgi:RsmE family RNA methyltransferase